MLYELRVSLKMELHLAVVQSETKVPSPTIVHREPL